jgi:predicted outer membrane repeat protein
MERRFMNGRFIRAAAGAVTAGLLATAAGGAQSALAAPRGAVDVPCSAPALTAAIKGASGGETLSLAPLCSYGLTAALPPIVENLTINGNHATIERAAAAGTPEFAPLTVGLNHGSAIGTLATSNLNIRNGDPGINLVQGALSVQGGTFTSNATAISSTFFTTLSVAGARFTDNTGREGGAIFSGWNTNVTDSTFTDNSALRGGAVYAQYGTQTIARCHFAGNTATGGGGALYDDSEITMTDSTFTSNHAAAGGAITVFDPASAGLAVTGSTFIANAARIGGAIYNYDGLTATDDVFTANHATQGGAVDQDWYATLTGDLFTRNMATASGGGMYAGYHTMVRDSVLTRNTAGSQGGGIYNGLNSLDFGGPLIVSRSSITGNSAGTDGGGIFNHAALGATAGTAGTTVTGNLPDNCAPPGAIAGCAAMATALGGGASPQPDRGGIAFALSVPRHHSGHLPPRLLQELTGR